MLRGGEEKSTMDKRRKRYGIYWGILFCIVLIVGGCIDYQWSQKLNKISEDALNDTEGQMIYRKITLMQFAKNGIQES